MVNERLQKLRQQKQALENRIRQEKGREKARKRNEDTRRKILAGAWVLEEMEQRAEFKAFMLRKLDHFLSKSNDRALFGLPLRDQDMTQTSSPEIDKNKIQTPSEEGQ